MNQLWFEKDRKVLVRIFKHRDQREEEIQFDKHVNVIGKTWIETFMKKSINDKLVQTESYCNLSVIRKAVDNFLDTNFYGNIALAYRVVS